MSRNVQVPPGYEQWAQRYFAEVIAEVIDQVVESVAVEESLQSAREEDELRLAQALSESQQEAEEREDRELAEALQVSENEAMERLRTELKSALDDAVKPDAAGPDDVVLGATPGDVAPLFEERERITGALATARQLQELEALDAPIKQLKQAVGTLTNDVAERRLKAQEVLTAEPMTAAVEGAEEGDLAELRDQRSVVTTALREPYSRESIPQAQEALKQVERALETVRRVVEERKERAGQLLADPVMGHEFDGKDLYGCDAGEFERNKQLVREALTPPLTRASIEQGTQRLEAVKVSHSTLIEAVAKVREQQELKEEADRILQYPAMTGVPDDAVKYQIDLKPLEEARTQVTEALRPPLTKASIENANRLLDAVDEAVSQVETAVEAADQILQYPAMTGVPDDAVKYQIDLKPLEEARTQVAEALRPPLTKASIENATRLLDAVDEAVSQVETAVKEAKRKLAEQTEHILAVWEGFDGNSRDEISDTIAGANDWGVDLGDLETALDKFEELGNRGADEKDLEQAWAVVTRELQDAQRASTLRQQKSEQRSRTTEDLANEFKARREVITEDLENARSEHPATEYLRVLQTAMLELATPALEGADEAAGGDTPDYHKALQQLDALYQALVQFGKELNRDSGLKQWQLNQRRELSDGFSDMVLLKDEFKPGGADYQKGMVPGTDEDPSSFDQSWDEFSESDKQMVEISEEVLNQVRQSLPRGPFNNYGGLPQEVLEKQNHPDSGEHSPAWWNQVVDAAAQMAVDQLKVTLPDVPEFKLSMACLARATKEVGGGVCSKMATLTSSTLTTALPPGSEIAQVFSSFDHEFVIARIPGSRWFVVDPWCQDPLAVPFVDCYFDPKSVKGFISIKIKEKAPKDKPLGIDVETGVDWPDLIDRAEQQIGPTDKDMSHVFGQSANVSNPKYYDKKLSSAKSNEWGT